MESMASMVIPVLESRDWDTNCLTMNVFKGNYTIQWNLNLVTTFDLVTIFQRPFFNLQSNLVIRNFLVTLKLFLNTKCSLSL